MEIIGKGQGWDRMVAKAGEYLEMGVDRVWILDPDEETVHVYRRDKPPTIHRSNDTLRDEEILAGFSCKVADFFRD